MQAIGWLDGAGDVTYGFQNVTPRFPKGVAKKRHGVADVSKMRVNDAKGAAEEGGVAGGGAFGFEESAYAGAGRAVGTGDEGVVAEVDGAKVLAKGYEAIGASPMPPLGLILKPQELEDIKAYLQTLK